MYERINTESTNSFVDTHLLASLTPSVELIEPEMVHPAKHSLC